MAISPSRKTARSPLYRSARYAVIFTGLALMLAQLLLAQSSTRAKASKSPRALGLIELGEKGKARLIPVVIMIDGEFYDASAYKAAPVPLALYSDTVYEGMKTGVSQGLLTITDALHGNNIWVGEGKWKSAEEIAAADAKRKKSAEAEAKAKTDETEGPPVLKRREEREEKDKEKDKDTSKAAPTPTSPASTSPASTSPTETKPAGTSASAPTATSSTASSTTPPSTSPASPVPAPTPQTTTAAAGSSGTTASPTASVPATNDAPADPNVPELRRGKPARAPEVSPSVLVGPAAKISGSPSASPTFVAPASGPSASAATNDTQLFPAISDEAGPEPRPYAYSMKPEEEAKFRDKMLALAAIEVRARAKDLNSAAMGTAPSPAAPKRTSAAHTPVSSRSAQAKPPQPTFDNVQLRVFDLSNSNEPVLVLTANSRLPQSKGANAADMQYLVTLVTRNDIYGDLHKVFSNVTDTQHLDVLPRVELIDAVDADGDGRGELLFRDVSDSSSAFALYRVIGDQLWPLFQGKL